MVKQISHIGVVVRELEKARNFYSSLLNLSSSSPIEGSGMKMSLVHAGNAEIELLEPTTKEGVLAKFLERHGEGVHHICFEVDDIESELESLQRKGMELVDKKPRPGAEGKVAFLHPRMTFGVLIELVEKEK